MQHAAHFARRLESLLGRAPYEWFNFFEFWEQRSRAQSNGNP